MYNAHNPSYVRKEKGREGKRGWRRQGSKEGKGRG